MTSEIQYHTKQYEKLLNYLKSIPGKHFTAQELCSHFSATGEPIGLATIYRQLERMLESGLVQKYIIEGSSACFEFIGSHGHLREENCFHCKCILCGRLIHLECEEILQLQNHILKKHNFTLDTSRTVFYGTCVECSLSQKTESEES